MERLAVDGEALSACFGDGAYAFSCADVDEVNGAHLVFGEADCAAEGDVLGEVGVDMVHVPPVPEVALGGVVVVVHDHVVVFGVDHEDAAASLDLVHNDG